MGGQGLRTACVPSSHLRRWRRISSISEVDLQYKRPCIQHEPKDGKTRKRSKITSMHIPPCVRGRTPLLKNGRPHPQPCPCRRHSRCHVTIITLTVPFFSSSVTSSIDRRAAGVFFVVPFGCAPLRSGCAEHGFGVVVFAQTDTETDSSKTLSLPCLRPSTLPLLLHTSYRRNPII